MDPSKIYKQFVLSRIKNKIIPSKEQLMGALNIESGMPILMRRKGWQIEDDNDLNMAVYMGHLAKGRKLAPFTFEPEEFVEHAEFHGLTKEKTIEQPVKVVEEVDTEEVEPKQKKRRSRKKKTEVEEITE